MTMDKCWQDDWNIFVDLLTEYLRAGTEPDALLARFAGKTICWTGHFEEADLDDLAPNVYIELPPRAIDFGDGRTAVVDGISLPVAEGSRSEWLKCQKGSEVTFRAVMLSRESLFPPIWIKTFESGKTIVTVGLANGSLVG